MKIVRRKLEKFKRPGTLTFAKVAENLGTTSQHLTTDGVLIDFNQSLNAYFLHGSEGECGIGMSCVGRMYTYGLDGVVQAWDPVARRGADATYTDPHTYFNYDSDIVLSSLLVADMAAVPLPAAVWLFSSGMMGLVLITAERNLRAINALHDAFWERDFEVQLTVPIKTTR